MKFTFDVRWTSRVLGLLRARCRPDRRHPTGIVSSVYFDTPDWQHLDEKRNGDHTKSKVRVRWYARLDTGAPLGFAFLEAKLKTGATRRKVRLPTELPASEVAALPLHGEELRRLPERLRSEGVPVSGTLLATFEIAYARYRFVDPETGARLSVDTDIRIPRTNEARTYPPPPLAWEDAVFEVKGELDDLPPGLAELRELGCRKQAFSKYETCHQWLTGETT